jgi:CheY-like chemotaxis protein
MPKILLIGTEAEGARELAPRLERHGYSVREYAATINSVSQFANGFADFDVVLVDISRDRPEDWALLDALCALRIGAPMQPSIICASRAYRGPRMRLEVERRGARLVIYGG